MTARETGLGVWLALLLSWHVPSCCTRGNFGRELKYASAVVDMALKASFTRLVHKPLRGMTTSHRHISTHVLAHHDPPQDAVAAELVVCLAGLLAPLRLTQIRAFF